MYLNAQFGCTFAAKCVLTVIRAALLSFLRVADITRRAAEHGHTDKILSIKRFIQRSKRKKKKKNILKGIICQLMNNAAGKINEMYPHRELAITEKRNTLVLSYRSQYWPV